MASVWTGVSFAESSVAGGVVAPARWGDESELVTQAQNGSVAATELLMGLYETKILRITERITNNREDAEEAAQNAFFKAFHNMASFRRDSRFYTWLVRIAVNEALMILRRRPAGRVSIDGIDQPKTAAYLHLEDSRPDPEEEYSQQEMTRILGTSLGKMKPGYRIAFKLRAIEGLSTREVALALDVSQAAVKNRVRRVRIHLKNSLKASFRSRKNMPKHSIVLAPHSTVRQKVRRVGAHEL